MTWDEIPLLPDYPYRDLDGKFWPHCDHGRETTDPVELAILRGVADTILAAGLPEPFVRVGDEIQTTWGCEGNKRLKIRKAIVTRITVGLSRHTQSMCHKPAYQYIGHESTKLDRHGMCLAHILRADGQEWREEWIGDWAPFHFRVEWRSPLHGGIERAYRGPFGNPKS